MNPALTYRDSNGDLQEKASLKASLRRVERVKKVRSAALVMPLFLFVMVFYVIPIGLTLYKSVDNPEVVHSLPKIAHYMLSWHGSDLPSDDVFYTLALELKQAQQDNTLGEAARRMGYEMEGMRSLVLMTARELDQFSISDTTDARRVLIEIDKRWQELSTWQAIKRSATRYTKFYLLYSLDLAVNDRGEIRHIGSDRAIYVNIMLRTFWVALVVTGVCFVLGYPVACLLANTRAGISNLLMIAVMLPFWTSVLVRISGWVVILQTDGIANKLLQYFGVIEAPLKLLHYRPAVYIGMIHVLLPFMILPLYSVAKTISPSHMRAALSLGAHPVRAFSRIYFPQTLPGISGGVILVFILALGYYITPALLGGPKDQLISFFIAYHTNKTLNWGLASALALFLLMATLVLYAAFRRLTRSEAPTLG